MNYSEVILKFYPNTGFAIGETYESLVWMPETNIPKPTSIGRAPRTCNVYLQMGPKRRDMAIKDIRAINRQNHL